MMNLINRTVTDFDDVAEAISALRDAYDELQAENDRLKDRIAELEQEILDRRGF